MRPVDPYRIPAGEHRTRDEISRSRFVTTLAPAATVDEAQAFVARIRAEFPDATHNCWAYLVGPPGSTGRVGMSDDGEPHGTAGRPMLTALLHSGIGDVAAVVTRYYGGTKLGTGGLVRAYGGGVAGALATLPTAVRVTWARIHVVVDYDAVASARQLVAAHGGRLTDETYAAEVRYAIELPAPAAEDFARALRDVTRGRARIDVEPSSDVG